MLFVLAFSFVISLDIRAASNVTQCRTTHRVYDLPGFTIQSGEIKLNPETREMQWRGKIAKLTKSRYLLLENLILAGGAPVTINDFIIESRRNAIERGSDPDQFAYSDNWYVVNILRLRTFLRDNFEPSLADRIVTLQHRGFAWTTDQMLMDAQKYDPSKLTYLPDQQRIFKGTKEIFLTQSTWLVVDRYASNSFQRLTRENWNAIWSRTFHKNPSYNALSIVMARANKELADLFGTDARVLLKDGPYGAGGWRLDSNFFDLESMSRTGSPSNVF